MPQISIGCTSRLDNYEGGCINRLIYSIKNNCNLLEDLDIDYEYINVEWNPIDQYLTEYKDTKGLFDKYNLRNIVLDKSVVINEQLDINKYYEYFAKNIFIRNSLSDIVLITNCDILFTKDLLQNIKELLPNLKSDKFYRAIIRNQVDFNGNTLESKNLYEPFLPDGHLCAGFSGDFLLAKRVTLVNVGGYDETNPDHRTGFQTHMDGEILWQLDKNGIKLEIIKQPYQHIWHGKTRKYDSIYYNQKGYENKPNWGFIDYKHNSINDKLTVITND